MGGRVCSCCGNGLLLKATFLASDGSVLQSIRNPRLQGLMSRLGLFPFFLPGQSKARVGMALHGGCVNRRIRR